MPELPVYIGLGSNLENPEQQVLSAMDELAALPRSTLAARSSLYRSVPMGPQDQPDFVNAVLCLMTSLSADELLRQLQSVEQRHGRVRSQHWGPRTLDLDILLYGQDVIDTAQLQVPHPGIAERNFVLYPLAEIAGDLDIPGKGPVSALLGRCPDTGLTRLAPASPASEQQFE